MLYPKSLDKYLSQSSPIVPVRVIGSGRGLSNVPKGATGTVLSIKDNYYQIQWDDPDVKEDLIKLGSVCCDLDVI